MEQISVTTRRDIESRKKLGKYSVGMSGGLREALAPKKAGYRDSSRIVERG